jgi:hypothetical protein
MHSEHHKLLASAEFQHPSDNKERANFGVEYTMNDMFFARTGYHSGYDAEGVAFGFGAAIKTSAEGRLQVDYAAVDMGPLQYVHRLSLRVVY